MKFVSHDISFFATIICKFYFIYNQRINCCCYIKIIKTNVCGMTNANCFSCSKTLNVIHFYVSAFTLKLRNSESRNSAQNPFHTRKIHMHSISGDIDRIA